MYSSYSQFQQFQLAQQPYQDTQQVWLAVYGPGRCTALAHSLELQLHRKFMPVHSLNALPQDLSGVVVAAEDVECLSTTLSLLCCRPPERRRLCLLRRGVRL